MNNIIKNLNIFKHYITGNNLPKLESCKNNKKINRKILIATSSGGLQSILVFEALLGNILKYEGCEVDFLLCDEILSGCVMKTIFNNTEKQLLESYSNKTGCSICFLRAKNYLEKYKLNVLKFSDFIDKKKIKAIEERKYDNLSSEEIKKIVINDIPVGEHANSGTIRYYTGTNLENYKYSKEVLIQYLKSAIITKEVSENLFNLKKYDEVFMNHGVYVPQGVIIDCAKKRKINTAAWFYNYKINSVCITRNDTYHKALLDEAADKWNNFKFTKKEEMEIDKYLFSKRTGTMDMEYYFKNPHFDIENFFNINGVDSKKPIISLATNMLWDAQVYFPSNFFSNMIEWLYFTIDHFKKRKDLQLIIRIHPAEADKQKPSKQRVMDCINEKYKSIPENIFIVKPEDNLSTYAIIDKSNALIVYGSKIATESAANGIPTIVCGESFIKNKSITFDAFNKKQYLELLDKLPFDKNVLDKDKILLAKKYAYHFWFRRTIFINSLLLKKNKSPNVGIKKNYLDLYQKDLDKGLKSVVKAIAEGNDFINYD